MRPIIYYFLLIIICIGCSNKNPQGSNMNLGLQEANSFYKKDILSMDMPPLLTDHFPENIISLPTEFSCNKDSSWGIIYYTLIEYNVNDNNLNNLEQKLVKFPQYGTCKNNIVIKKRRVFSELSKDDEYSHINGRRDVCVVPFFFSYNHSDDFNQVKTDDIYTDRTITGLKKDFDIYIIDSKPGIYYEGLKLLDSMPKGWEHGYSKGVCINKKHSLIAYWVIIW